MALPAFRAAGASASSVTTATPGAPAGLASNDVELLLVESMDEAVTLSTANGFAEVTNSPISVPNADPLIATRLTVFWRRWNGTDGDPVVADAGDHVISKRVAFSGCITTGNPWDITVASSEAVENLTGEITGGTTTVADCLVVLCAASAKPNATADPGAVFSAWTNADLSTLTEQVDFSNTAGNGGALGLAEGGKASAGAFTTTTYTHSNNTYKAHLAVALKPPAAEQAIPLRSQHLDYDYSR